MPLHSASPGTTYPSKQNESDMLNQDVCMPDVNGDAGSQCLALVATEQSSSTISNKYSMSNKLCNTASKEKTESQASYKYDYEKLLQKLLPYCNVCTYHLTKGYLQNGIS